MSPEFEKLELFEKVGLVVAVVVPATLLLAGGIWLVNYFGLTALFPLG